MKRRRRNFEHLDAVLARRPEVFVRPRTTPELETAWHMFPFLIRPESGVRRSDYPAQGGVPFPRGELDSRTT